MEEEEEKEEEERRRRKRHSLLVCSSEVISSESSSSSSAGVFISSASSSTCSSSFSSFDLQRLSCHFSRLIIGHHPAPYASVPLPWSLCLPPPFDTGSDYIYAPHLNYNLTWLVTSILKSMFTNCKRRRCVNTGLSFNKQMHCPPLSPIILLFIIYHLPSFTCFPVLFSYSYGF